MARVIRGRQVQVESSKGDMLEHVAATLATLVDELKGAAAAPKKLPRGTRDVTQQAGDAAVAASAPEQSLRDRIRDQLLRSSLDSSELSRNLKVPMEQVVEEVKAAAKEGLVANIGAEDFPMWTWRVGDNTPTPELNKVVRRLITERPMTTRELVHATGASMTRVGGAIVAIQRSGSQILDLNPRSRAGRWFIVLSEARDARLKPKQENGNGNGNSDKE